MRSFIVLLLICFYCSFANANTLSNNYESYFSTGIDLFKSGNFQESYDILLLAFDEHPENPELNFYLGRAAYETQNYEMAIMAFERVLITSPLEQRVKLEMARAFHRLGANNTARQYCQEVLATNPPKLVKDNIERFLIYIDKTEQKHFFWGQALVGVDWNSNIWATPLASLIDTIIGDVSLTGLSAVKTSDWVYNTAIDLNHTYRPRYSKFNWKSNANFYGSFYDKYDELNLAYISGYTGPEFIMGKNILGIRFLLNHIELDNAAYQNGIGAGAVFDHNINSYVLTSTSLKYESKDFPTTSGMNSNNISLTFDIDIGLKSTWFGAGLNLEREDANEEEYTYNRLTADVSITRELKFKTKGALVYEYEYSDYDGSSSLFDKNREDQTHSLGGSLEKTIWHSLSKPNQNISLKLNYIHTWAFSNINLYEYEKDLVQMALIYNF
jgi:tetratricopeptide (TPR) repeat protein